MITSREEWKHIFESSGCLRPLAAQADEALERLLCTVGNPAELLEESGAQSIRKLLYDRLTDLYPDLLSRLLKEDMDQSSYLECVVLSDACTPQLLRAAQELAGKLEGSGWDRAMEEFPAAAELNHKITENFIASQAEFLARYRQYRPEISERFFGGREAGKILSYTNARAIPRQHGRIVTGVLCEGGCFYYKPHDCGIDGFYREITERFFPDVTRAPLVIEGDGFGFCTELVPEPLEKKEDAARYFYNYGALAALFTVLNGSDLHALNVLACGVFPCAIDLENILSVTVSRSEAALTDAEKAQRLSVSSAGVLGRRSYMDPGLISPLHMTGDASCAIDLTGSGGRSPFHNLPEYAGRRFDVRGFEESFIDGFRDGYERMAGAKKEVLSMLEKRPRIFVRNLFISPKFHEILLGMLFWPDSLAGAAGQAEVLDRLRLGYTGSGKKLNRQVLRYEEACLREADLPYYCVDVFGTDLCGADGTVLAENEFVRSPCACLQDMLESLSEAEQEMEITLIRRSFDHLMTDDPADYACSFREERARIGAGAMEKEMEEILSALCRDSIPAPDGTVFWLDPMQEYAGKSDVPFCAIQSDAAALCAGILRAAENGSTRERARRLLDQCLLGVEDKLRVLQRSGGMIKEPGLLCGAGGILNGLRLAEGSSGRAGSAIDDLLALLLESPLEEDGRLDADGGTAGLLIALSMLRERKDPAAEAARRALLERYAGRLSRALDDPAAMNALRAVRDPFKGGCGAAAALAMSRREPGGQEDTDRIQSLFSAACDSFSESICGWYSMEKDRRYQKGDYAAGIGLCAIAALPAAGDPDGAVRKCLALALRSEMSGEGLLRQDILRGGNALRVLFLDQCEALFPGRGYAQRADRILSGMLERKRKNGGFVFSPQGIRNVFAPSFLLGISGIGCVLLKHTAKGAGDGKTDFQGKGEEQALFAGAAQ
ncbi:MAG: DUF4135 domain-containing protein [Eubacteriales bacterium]|nr:DUF4135 domain-containing protein [Eubacteriales bacterium]